MNFLRFWKFIFVLFVVLILTYSISINKYAIGQTPSPVIAETPTISPTSTSIKKKVPHSQIHFSDTMTKQEANEEAARKMKELEKEGLLDTFSTPGTGKGWGPRLPAPENFVVKPGNASAYLKWDAVPGAGQYFVYISNDDKNYLRPVFTPIKDTYMTILNLTNGKTYYFEVAAFGNWVGLRAKQMATPKVDK